MYSVLVLNNNNINNNMTSNLDSRLGQSEEQGKTMVESTKRLLETVNAVNNMGELLLQLIENHQKSRKFDERCENGSEG